MPRRILLLCAVVVSVVITAFIFWPRTIEKPSSGGASSAEPATPQRDPAEKGSTELVASAEPTTAVARFSNWSETFLSTPAADRTADLMTQGAELARNRRAEMAELIKHDPKAALEAAVPMAVRQRLPQAIVNQLEERVSGRGFYGVLVATDFEKLTRDVRREVVIGNETYDGFVYGRRSAQVTQQRVPLWGIAVPNPAKESGPKLLAIHEDPLRAIEPGEVISASPPEPCPVSTDLSNSKGSEAFADVGGRIEKFCMASHINLLNDRLAADVGLGGQGGFGDVTARDSWSQGPKTCLYMRITFPDDPDEPITEDEAYARMDEVNQWFIENSYDSTQIVPTVTPLLMMPYPKAFYSEQGTSRLLADARDAARLQANLDTDNFTWDIVRHPSVPGFDYGGLAYVRGKGVWLQSSGTGVTCHELGHNYGLWHANYWTASGDSIIGPGSHSEYGNSFDTMGAASAGANHFNAAFKYQLDWLPESFIHNVTTNGVYRIYTFDAPGIVSGQKYAIRVRKDYDRNYWAEFHQRFTHRWFLNGVVLNWDPWDNGVSDSAGGTHLLDTTPGSPDGKNDSPVIVGRTYSDVPAGVHITPLARSGTGENWMDVAVNVGAFPSNTPPIANLIADRTTVGAGANANFSVVAYDPDGDPLAYAWDFGDLNFGPNASSVSKNWPVGEYTVRCTVSDMKGGTYTAKTLITVGTPTTFRISGRIVDEQGAPLEGVRVHNGQSGTAYRGTLTDSDGFYILANNSAGSHTINAIKYGYTFNSLGWANPIAVGPHATNRHFNATSMPVVSIAATDAQAGETPAATGRFVLTRTGPTGSPLAVNLNRGGTATANTDYTLSLNPSGSPLQYTIPAGSASLAITVTPVGDTTAEGPESVLLTLQADAAYALGSLAEAAVILADDEGPGIPGVDISASTPQLESDNLATESGSDSATFTFTRTGSVAGELAVGYSISGTATEGTDYQDLSGIITIPAGQTIAVLPFRTIDDIEVENNETVTLTLLTSAAYTGGGDSTTITIIDDDLPNVFVTASDDTARENNASGGNFVVSRIGRLDINLRVNFTLEGTASFGADYPALAALSIIIPAGSATADIPIPAINDGLNEGEESVIIRLSSSSSYNVGNPGSATIIIVDDEGANVTLSASDASAAEVANPGAFTFSRAGGTIGAPLVVYFAVNGTAARGIDYTDIPNFITIPAGATSFVLPISPINDAINEDNETVTVGLLPAPEYTMATTAPQTVTITSEDTGAVGVGFTVAESSGNETVTGPLLSVQLSKVATQPVSVNYAVSGGSATGGGVDYTLAAGTITLLPSTNNQSFRITVVNDTTAETNETIRVTLSSPVNAVLDGISTHTYTIIDDDRFGNVTATATTPNALEAGAVPGMFRIQRSGSTVSNLVVEYQILGSASSPADYEPIPSLVTIPIGVSFVDVTITPVDDSTDETNETVTLNLLNAPGGRLASPSDTATVNIIDDDSSANLPTVSIVATDNTASEPGSDTGAFTILRTGDTSADLTVSFSVSGTATAADYSSIGTSATIPAGATETTVTITPVDDATAETNETVTVTLTAIDSYRVGIMSHATVVIEDNEVAISIASDGNSSEDGSSTGSFVITRTGNVASDLTVNFVVSGTATRTNDFTAFAPSVVIPAGTNAVSIPVSTVDDTAAEGIETVVVSLTAGAGYTVRAPSSATVLILDDEAVVTITATDDTAGEPTASGVFTISRSGGVVDPLTVFFSVTGTASNGTDYASVPSQAVIPAGTNATALVITPIDDDLVEGPETVSVTLSTNSSYALGSPASALITIVDNEVNLPPSVQLVSPSANSVFLASTNLFLVLESRISDDGRPAPGVVTSLWTRVSGPAGSQANFAGPGSTNAFVNFNMNGVYVLRLTAGDGQLSTNVELTVVVNANAALTNGLQAWWRFNETSGTTAADASGNNRTATLANGAAFTAGGRFGYAAQFDGVDDIVNFTSPAAPQVSFSAWVNTTGDGDSTTPRIIASPGYHIRLRRDSGGLNISFEARRTTSSEWRTPLGSYTDNTWHHIMVAYDSATATTPAMYIDGEAQTVTSLAAGSGTHTSSAGAASIGNTSALDRSLLGRVDEFRVYNRALTAGDALLLSLGVPANNAPAVAAGADRSGAIGEAISLSGVVTDDAQPNPPGTVSNRWAKFSGPGTVTFSNENAAATSATFSDTGTYVLSLHSTDGQVKVFDQVIINVVNPPTVQVQTMATPGTEFGATSGRFMISRSTGIFSTTVYYTLTGGAANGLDYITVPTQIVLGPGQFSANVTIAPVLDSLAEGDETVTLTITPHSSYVIGQIGSTNLTITDRPIDSWRFARFNAGELSNPLLSGDSADPDGDAAKNLLEYALNLDPKSSNAITGFSAQIENVSGTDALMVTHKRRKAPRDIDYVLEVSPDLASWNSGGTVAQELSAIDDGNGITETVRLRVLSDVTQPGGRFVRLRVSRQ
jgi:hypothetical protein